MKKDISVFLLSNNIASWLNGLTLSADRATPFWTATRSTTTGSRATRATSWARGPSWCSWPSPTCCPRCACCCGTATTATTRTTWRCRSTTGTGTWWPTARATLAGVLTLHTIKHYVVAFVCLSVCQSAKKNKFSFYVNYQNYIIQQYQCIKVESYLYMFIYHSIWIIMSMKK